MTRITGPAPSPLSPSTLASGDGPLESALDAVCPSARDGVSQGSGRGVGSAVASEARPGAPRRVRAGGRVPATRCSSVRADRRSSRLRLGRRRAWRAGASWRSSIRTARRPAGERPDSNTTCSRSAWAILAWRTGTAESCPTAAASAVAQTYASRSARSATCRAEDRSKIGQPNSPSNASHTTPLSASTASTAAPGFSAPASAPNLCASVASSLPRTAPPPANRSSSGSDSSARTTCAHSAGASRAKVLQRNLADLLQRAREDQRDRPAPGQLIGSRKQGVDRRLGDRARAPAGLPARIAAHVR